MNGNHVTFMIRYMVQQSYLNQEKGTVCGNCTSQISRPKGNYGGSVTWLFFNWKGDIQWRKQSIKR